jgi:hypothetical protein
MTEIVRASLGLPTLRAGPQFRNFKSLLVIEYWNLRFNCNLVLGIWDFEMIDDLTNQVFTVYRLPFTNQNSLLLFSWRDP